MTVRNAISGTIKKIPWSTLIVMFDASVRDQIVALSNRPHVEGLMVYQCLQLDSTMAGQCAAVIYGPGCTFKTLDHAAQSRLGQVPSQFQYPVAYWPTRPEVRT